MKKRLLFFGKCLLTVFIFWVIFSRIDTSRLGAALAKTDAGFLLAGIFFLWLATVFVAWGGSAILRAVGVNKDLFQVFRINYSSYFYGFLSEWAAGGVRWIKIAGSDQRRGEAFFLILVERGLTTTANFIFYCLGFYAFAARFFDSREKKLFLLVNIALGFVITLFLVMLVSRRLAGAARSFATSIGRTRFLGLVSEKSLEVLRVLGNFQKDPADFYRVLGIFLVNTLTGIAGFWFLLKAVGVSLGFADALWVCAFTAVVQCIPLTVMGLGIREGTLIYALSKYGVPNEVSLILGFLWFLIIVFLSLVGGLWVLADSVKKKE